MTRIPAEVIKYALAVSVMDRTEGGKIARWIRIFQG